MARWKALPVSEGELEVEVGSAIERPRGDETLRYRSDRPHDPQCVAKTSLGDKGLHFEGSADE